MKAVEECDHLGRQNFLAKYGFRPAKNYLLEVGGGLYDSKAIAGVAYGYEHPEQGPLISSEFSGGERSVAAVLRNLGFKVTPPPRVLGAKYDALLRPGRVWSRDEVLLSEPCPVPTRSGVYAWFFKEVPPGVPDAGCLVRDGLTLLYVGISPKEPPRNGGPPSNETLRKRICFHFRGNAEGSTLRLTIGCLLASELGLELRRVGSGHRRTFCHDGEDKLSDWMKQNAFVTWMAVDKPWEFERRLIKSLWLPLNLADNGRHPFYQTLKELRKKARARADSLGVVSDELLEST